MIHMLSRFVMHSTRFTRPLMILCALCLFLSESNCGSALFAADGSAYQLHLQVQWTAPRNSRRTIILLPGENVSVEQGAVFRDAALRREELIAQLKRAPGQEWRISFDDPATRGGVTFLCQGSSLGTLHVVLRDEAKLLGETTLTLADLSQPAHEITLPKGEGTLRIFRENASPIQVLPGKSHVVHEPGEQFRAQVVGQFTGPIDRKRHPVLHWEILSSRASKLLSEGKLNFQIPKRVTSSALAMDVQIPLPAQEGVYDLRFQLETREGAQPGFQTIQIVVHGSTPTSMSALTPADEQRFVSLVSAETKSPAESVLPIPTVEENRTPIERKLGLVLHSPWQLTNLWSDRATDPETGRQVADWTTISTAGKKLVSELLAQKATVLILGVHADGVVLTPNSAEAYRSTAIDDGRLRSSTLDPFPKDILELLFREFDQRGCTLIPELNLNAIDEPLEQQRLRTSAGRDRIDLRNQAGHSWSETHPESALGAHYDPLAPEVQQRIDELAAEIIVRYQHHKSFGGIALSLHGETWACLPGVNWGQGQNPTRTASLPSPITPATSLEDSPSISPAKIALRCRSLAELYSRISRRLDQSKAERRLYLTLDKLLPTGSCREDAIHLLHAGQSLENLFPFSGIEPKLLAQESGIRLLRPYLFASQKSVSAEEAVLLSAFNASPAITQSFQGSNAVLLAKTPIAMQAARQITSPGQADPSRFWAQVLGSGDIHELFATWTSSAELGIRQERSLARIIHQLPGWRGRTLVGVTQPLSIQKITATDETWLLVINGSALPVTWEFQTAGKLGGPIVRTLGQGTDIQKLDQERTWSWSLQPYDVQACRIPTPSFELSSTKVIIPPDQLTRISDRIERLEKSFVAIRERTSAEKYLLPNADFEQETPQPAQPPGWNYEFESNPPPRLDTLNPRSGKHALKLHCDKASVPSKITTFPLSLNREKHLAVSLWLRAAQPDSQVRLVFSGPRAKDWSKTTDLTCSPEWQHFVFRISDVPAELKEATLGIQFSSVGSIWVDDVEMFPQRITPNDERQLTRNLSAIRLAWQEQRYSDCLRLLDGYWARFLTDAPHTSTSSEPRLPQLGTRYRELIIR